MKQTSLIVSLAFGYLELTFTSLSAIYFPMSCAGCHASGLLWEQNSTVLYLKSQVSVGSDQFCIFCTIFEESEYWKMVSLKCWTALAGLYCS